MRNGLLEIKRKEPPAQPADTIFTIGIPVSYISSDIGWTKKECISLKRRIYHVLGILGYCDWVSSHGLNTAD